MQKNVNIDSKESVLFQTILSLNVNQSLTALEKTPVENLKQFRVDQLIFLSKMKIKELMQDLLPDGENLLEQINDLKRFYKRLRADYRGLLKNGQINRRQYQKLRKQIYAQLQKDLVKLQNKKSKKT